MSVPTPTPAAPPGWYRDPVHGQWCWWDGWRWVSPMPPAPPAATRWFPTTPALQLPAAIAGIVFIVAITVATRITELLPDGPAAIAGLALFAVSTVGMPLLAWYGSRRWGTGRLVDDLGLRFRWSDLFLGLAGGVALTITLMIVTIITYVLGVPKGSNLTEIAEQGRDVVTFVILFVTAGIVAPVTEELVFRGLIQRGLASRWAPWTTVGLQAIVFGLAHVTPSEGWGNVDLTLSLAVMGVGLGAIARLTGRLGTGIIAHATFNCIQLTLLWVSLG